MGCSPAVTNIAYRKLDRATGCRSVRLRRTDRRGIDPLAIDAKQQFACIALKKLDGRDALYRISLDGRCADDTRRRATRRSTSTMSMRIGRGQQRDRLHLCRRPAAHRLFRSRIQDSCRPFAGQGAAEPADHRLRRRQRATVQAAAVRRRSDTDPGTITAVRQNQEVARRDCCSPGPELGRMARSRRSSRSPIAARDGTTIPAYLTLPAGSSRQGLAGGRPAPRRAERARRMGLRLARAIPRRARLCRDPAQLSRLGGLWRRLGSTRTASATGRRRLATSRRRAYLVKEGIADPNGWRSSAGPMAAMPRSSRRRSSPTVQGGRRDCAGHRPRLAQERSGRLHQRQLVKTSSARARMSRTVRRCATPPRSRRRCCWSTATSTPMSGSPQQRRWTTALPRGGKTVELLRFKGLDHQLDDSSARTEMLTKIGALLERTIGH